MDASQKIDIYVARLSDPKLGEFSVPAILFCLSDPITYALPIQTPKRKPMLRPKSAMA